MLNSCILMLKVRLKCRSFAEAIRAEKITKLIVSLTSFDQTPHQTNKTNDKHNSNNTTKDSN